MKIFWICESNTGYGLNAIAYGEKEGNRVHHNLAQVVVLKVVEPWYGTGKDICTDNYFTNYILANQLLQQNLTLLGTVCRHRRNVPSVLRQKDELYWSKFGFNHGDGICLVTYQAKRNENPLILLSSSHSDRSVDNSESKKLQMIMNYNASKSTHLTKIWKNFLVPEKCPLACPILFQCSRRCCKQCIQINAEE